MYGLAARHGNRVINQTLYQSNNGYINNKNNKTSNLVLNPATNHANSTTCALNGSYQFYPKQDQQHHQKSNKTVTVSEQQKQKLINKQTFPNLSSTVANADKCKNVNNQKVEIGLQRQKSSQLTSIEPTNHKAETDSSSFISSIKKSQTCPDKLSERSRLPFQSFTSRQHHQQQTSNESSKAVEAEDIQRSMIYALASIHFDLEEKSMPKQNCSPTKMSLKNRRNGKRKRSKNNRVRFKSDGTSGEEDTITAEKPASVAFKIGAPLDQLEQSTDCDIKKLVPCPAVKNTVTQPSLAIGLKGSKSSPCFQEEDYHWANQQTFLARSTSRAALTQRRYLSTSANKNFIFNRTQQKVAEDQQQQAPDLAEKASGSSSQTNLLSGDKTGASESNNKTNQTGSARSGTRSARDQADHDRQSFKKLLNESKAYKYQSRLFTIGCGFSKDDDPKIKLESENLSKYCISEDSASRNFGEDAAFIFSSESADILGVSDGVGGWRNHGVDPSKFSFGLMDRAKALATAGNFKVNQPVQLLSRAYNQLTSIPDLIGSATAVLASFDRTNGVLYTANLGDSGFLIVRNGEIVHMSKPQCHAFNAPYQLAIVPGHQKAGSFNDTPQKADYSEFQCQEGDIIILASDGVYDNVHLQHISKLLELMEVTPEKILRNFTAKGKPENRRRSLDEDSGFQEEDGILKEDNEKIIKNLEKAASTFVTFARRNAYNEEYDSPFSMEARRYGYKNTVGGKVDDITILVSIVGSLKN